MNPGIILTRVSVYGQNGPYRDRPGLDRNGIAMGGLLYLTGYPDRPPVRPGVIVSDYLTGVFNAFAILAAVYERDRRARETGQPPRGQWVDLALYESILRIMEHTLATYDRLGVVREREGNRLRNSAPLDNWETSDGKWVCIIAAGDGLFPRLARAMGREDLLAEPRFATMAQRAEHGDEINGIVADWVQAADVARDRRTCSSATRCRSASRTRWPTSSPTRTCAARDDIATVDDPVIGPVRMQGVYPRFSRTPGAIRSGAPRLGEHNDEVYRGLLGLDGRGAGRAPRRRRDLMRRRGVLRCVAVASLVVAPSRGSAWQRTLRYDGAPIAVTARGDLVTTVRVSIGRGRETGSVVAYDGRDGRRRWRWPTGMDADACGGAAIGADGRLTVRCQPLVYPPSEFPTLTTLAADTGTVAERRTLEGWPTELGIAPGITFDSAGDAVVFGPFQRSELTGLPIGLLVVKLDGSSGAEKWRFRLPDVGLFPPSVPVDAVGDPVMIVQPLQSGETMLLKLSGATGEERWRARLPLVGPILIGEDGTVIVAGSAVAPEFDERYDFALAVFDGASGTERWQARIAMSPSRGGGVAATALVGGDVVAVGSVGTAEDRSELIAVRFDGRTGSERWRRLLGGTYRGREQINSAGSIVVDGAGDLLIGGGMRNRRTCDDAVVLKLDGATGETVWMRTFDGAAVGRRCVDPCPEGFPCRSDPLDAIDRDYLTNLVADGRGGVIADLALVQRTSAERRTDRRLVVFSEPLAGRSLRAITGAAGALHVRSDDRRVLAPTPTDTDAPRQVGGTLRLVEPATGAATILALPARGWRSARVAGGWRWDFMSAAGPCRRVSVVTGRGLRIRCAGRSFGLPIGSRTDHLGVDLAFGDGARWCLAFEGTTNPTPAGRRRFAAAAAAPPARCE